MCLFKVQHMQHKTPFGLIVVAALAFLQGAMRLHFALGSTGALGSEMLAELTTMLEHPVTDVTLVITLPFLLLGVLGIVAAVCLLAERAWGLYGTVALSLVTIAYDAWAIVAIQPTAVLGIVLPVAFTVYLLMRRERILPRGVAA